MSDARFRPTCPSCGEKSPSGSKRCEVCGTWLLFDPPPSAPRGTLDRRAAEREAQLDARRLK